MTERGQYNASCTVYGYRKSKKDKHKLEIELEKAGIVADIEQKGRAYRCDLWGGRFCQC